mmetsp:Transcript_59778/g.177888  ORF Transcript_59778/g.177888 Transcript_59778/m.177888 type:complete len:218 (-) Transcript_59778:2-655(-)
MVVLEGEDQAFVPCDERHALGRCALAIGKMHISARCQQPHGAGDEVRLRVRLDRLFRLFDIRKRRTGHSQQRLHSRTVSHPWHTTTQYRQGATPMQVHGVDIRLVLDQNLQNVWAAACADGVAERRLERVLEEWQRGRLGLPRWGVELCSWTHGHERSPSGRGDTPAGSARIAMPGELTPQVHPASASLAALPRLQGEGGGGRQVMGMCPSSFRKLA